MKSGQKVTGAWVFENCCTDLSISPNAHEDDDLTLVISQVVPLAVDIRERKIRRHLASSGTCRCNPGTSAIVAIAGITVSRFLPFMGEGATVAEVFRGADFPAGKMRRRSRMNNEQLISICASQGRG